MRRVWGWASLLCLREVGGGGGLKLLLSMPLPRSQYWTPSSKEAINQASSWPPWKRVFIGSTVGFHWVKYINLATLHIPISLNVAGGGGGDKTVLSPHLLSHPVPTPGRNVRDSIIWHIIQCVVSVKPIHWRTKYKHADKSHKPQVGAQLNGDMEVVSCHLWWRKGNIKTIVPIPIYNQPQH